MAKTLDSASALVALSSSDLTAVSGGLFGSNSTTTNQTTSTQSGTTTVNPTLTCPAGTAPQWRRITGNLSGNVGTAGVGVNANGSGTYEEFNCVPVQTK